MDDSRDDAARNRFFDQQATCWSQVHYGSAGGMVSRIARFATALQAVAEPGADLLDYGCGTGDITAALVKLGYRVEGWDSSAEMIAQARRIHGQEIIRFALIGSDELRTAPHMFDGIVCSSVLEYVPDVPGQLGMLIGLLKPGGWLLATVPDIGHPARRGEPRNRWLMKHRAFRALVKWTPWGDMFELQWLSQNRFAVAQWVDQLRESGFQPVWRDGEDHPLALLVGRKPCEQSGI